MTATQMYQLYLDAEQKILKGQTVKFGERWLTLPDLPEIRKGRQEWEIKMRTEGNGGRGHSLASFN